MKNIYPLIIFLLVLSITACVSNQSSINASNDEDQDIGLGGTGILANTGNGLGGTGIIGEITGFGSIFVNGVEIEYDSKTTFTVNGKAAAQQQLVIGDVVEVLTTNNKQYTSAKIINLRHEVIGRVDSVNIQDASFITMGQTVKVSNKEVLPEKGTRVAVSGIRVNEKTIQASRIIKARSTQTLLRTQTELPFKGATNQWVIQTHVNNSNVSLQINGSPYRLSLKDKTGKSLNDRSVIRVLKLQKPTIDRLKLNRVIDPVNLPRGRGTSNPVQRQGNMMQRQMNMQPRMYRGGR
jgi:hypothetical protein